MREISDEETEFSVIASYLYDSQNLPLVMGGCESEDFSSTKARWIFEVSKLLYAQNAPVDPLGIHNVLKEKGKEVPVSDILEIQDNFFNGFDVAHYIQILKGFSWRREAACAFRQWQKKIEDQSIDYAALREQFGREIAALLDGEGLAKAQKIELPLLSSYAALDLRTEWAVYGVIVENYINALVGRTGLGKTTLMMQIGGCVSMGQDFLGLPTKRLPVYIFDYENPKETVCDRSRILPTGQVRIWDLSLPLPPPMLDSKRWDIVRNLEPGMLIIDTFRSSHSLKYTGVDERMVSLFSKLKDLRKLGFTIVLLIHTTKANDAIFKGPGDIPEQCDHIISLDRVREIGSDRIDDDDSRVDLPLRLGFRMKTRFQPTPPIYLKFDPKRGFFRAESPEDLALPELGRILEDYCAEKGEFPNQTVFFERVKASLQIKPRQFRSLLKKGNGKFWNAEKGPRNAWIYSPRSKDSVLQGNGESGARNESETTEFFSFTEPSKQTEKQDESQFFKKSTLSIRESVFDKLTGEEETMPGISDEELAAAGEEERDECE